LDPGKLPSNLAAGLRSNLFATWCTIPNINQAEFKGFKKRTTIYQQFFENYPAFKGLKQLQLASPL